MRPAKTPTAVESRVEIAAQLPLGEVSDSPPAFIDGAFTNLAPEDRVRPLRISMRKPEIAFSSATRQLPPALYLCKNSLQESLVRMATLYTGLAR